MSAIFPLPVCLTYWPRNYTTRVDPHVNNSHQVWSWYDHTLPSYSVFVCWYITWPCDIDLWPIDLEQLQCMAGHVTNFATKFEDPKTFRSWVTSYNGSHSLALSADTSRDFWPWLLTFWPWTIAVYGGYHVPNLATKFEDHTPISSWFMSHNVSRWLPLRMRTRPLRMRRITWPVSRGSKTITYLESPTPICLFTIQLLLGYDDD